MVISSRWMALLLPFLVVAGTGTIFGGLAGFLALLFAGGSVNSIVDFTGGTYLALAVLLPVALFGAVLVFWDSNLTPDEQLYSQPLNVVGALVLGGLLGSVLATGLYTLLVSLITSSLGGHDASAINSALFSRIGWQNFLVILAATTIFALPLSFWAYRKANS